MFEVTCGSADALCLADISVSAATELAQGVNRLGAELRELLQRIDMHVDEQHAHAKATSDVDEMQRLQDADPYRWLADGKHALQAGVMFAGRAVVQPTTF